MRAYALNHLSNETLLQGLATLVARDRATTSALLAHLAEVDARRLYAPAGYPSMHAYCVRELGLSEDAALKRIRAARTARQFPIIFEALADGRLHLSAIVMLKPHLAAETADELLTAVEHRTKSEIEGILAKRFPRSELLAWVEDLQVGTAVPPAEEVAPGPVGTPEGRSVAAVDTRAPRARVAPIAPRRFALQVSIGQRTRDKLEYAQSLLSHQIPSGDVAEVLDRALDVLIARLEKRKFASTDRPAKRKCPVAAGSRTIPAHVKRVVWKRDGGRCTFTADDGTRCPSRTMIEYDHVVPVALGGEATAENIRLRCRTHNQHEAGRAFGEAFMNARRDAARERTRARNVETPTTSQDVAVERARASEVVPWLRALGFRAGEAREAAAHSATHAGASIEDRVRVALSYFRPRAHGHLPANRGT